MASVPTGTKLGKYEVVKPLASGGMAELLLAKTAPNERPLVLKWIRPEQAIDSTFIDAFVSEGRRAVQLHHPNIVEVHEVGREDGTHYLAMEYVHGDDLRKLLARLHERRAKLPVQHLLAITTAVAGALQHAHEQVDADGKPVLHLGIKPANVIITTDGAVKLADFGIGRAALTEGHTNLLPAVAGYLSPEQCTGQPLDRRTDVFGLGILMYELAVGRRLFKGDNELVTMATIVAGDIPPPSKQRGDLPKELEAVIMKALARAPEDRFQSAQELHTALDKFATKAGVRGSLTTLAGYTKRLFGVRPEPWLTDDEATDVTATNDFDGSPKGLATPPIEALQSCSLPSFVITGEDSPITRVQKQVSRDLPTEQLHLASLKAADRAGQDKSTPVKIPSQANGPARAMPKPLPNRPMPAPVAPGRVKPKTVQIPVVAGKAENTKVMVPPTPPDETTQERTNVLVAANVAAGTEDFTDDNIKLPPMSAADVMTPTDPTPFAPKPGEDDTVPGTSSLAAPPAPAVKKPTLPPPAKPTNGVNGKPALVTLAGLRDADEKRDAAKRGKAAAADAVRFAKPVVAGEIERPPSAASSRTATDVDEVTNESTAVATPPTPTPVAATRSARDATEHVMPLPHPSAKSVTMTDSIVVGPRGNKKWLVLGGVAAAALAAIIIAVGFTGKTADPQPAANEQLAQDEPKPDEPPPPAPPPESELRVSDVPRTPRNSHVTVDDQKPEDSSEEPKVEPPKVEEPKVEPPPVPENKPKVVEDSPPPTFVEPKDPSPPDDVKPVKKPKQTKPKPAVVQKPKPTPVATKPKPKQTTKPKPKPTPVATKPKPTKPATKPKPTGAWDRNSLFPK